MSEEITIETVLFALLLIGVVICAALAIALRKKPETQQSIDPQTVQDVSDLFAVSMRVVQIGKRMGESDEEINKALDGVMRGWEELRKQRGEVR